MRSFRMAAILTALVGLLLGAGLAAVDPNLTQGGGVAQASGDNQAGGLEGLLQIVGKPFMSVLNRATGPVVKVGGAGVEQKLGGPGGGKPGGNPNPGSGGK